MTPTNQPNAELIDAYLAGELDAARLVQVEARLQTDQAFREEVDLQRALVQQLRAYGQHQLRAQMDQWEQEAAVAETPVRPIWQKIGYYAAAAVAVGALFTGLWFAYRPTKSSSPTPIGQFFQVAIQPAGTGLGFAGDSVTTDSVWVQWVTDQPNPARYRFGDTLVIQVGQLPVRQSQVRLEEEPGSGGYRLTVNDSLTYELERGFRQWRPLERTSTRLPR